MKWRAARPAEMSPERRKLMAMTERPTIVGVFENHTQAEQAINELQQAGFRDDQIGFAVRGGDEGIATVEKKTEAGPSAAAGAVTGGVLGGVLGAAAALLIPGFGPAIAGGILVAILGGAAIGAAAGGIIGALVGMGVPEEEALYYEDEFRAGRTIVTVNADGRQQEAREILHHHGAYDADTRFAQTTQPDTPQPDQVPDDASGYNPRGGFFEPQGQPGTDDPQIYRPR